MTVGSARSAALVVGALVALSACGPDGPDVYTAPPTDPPDAFRVIATTVPTQQTDDLTGGGGTRRAPVEATEPNGETVQVRALDNSFRAETIEIVAGTEVWWTNNGRNDHDVLPVDETLEWGVEVEAFTPGDEYRYVFLEPGTYPYYCSIHGTKEVGMVGTVVVLPPT